MLWLTVVLIKTVLSKLNLIFFFLLSAQVKYVSKHTCIADYPVKFEGFFGCAYFINIWDIGYLLSHCSLTHVTTLALFCGLNRTCRHRPSK